MKKNEYSGLEIEVRGHRLILISRRGGYQEIDITDVFHFFKEFFAGGWKKECEEISPKKKKGLPPQTKK